MSINVAEKIQVLKDNIHILKIENEDDETLWEYVEPTITGNDVLYAKSTTQTGWDRQPELYHITNDSTNKIVFYKYSNFDHTDSPVTSYLYFLGSRAWTDGVNTYINNYKYNTSTNTWVYQEWMVSPGQGYADDDLWVNGDYI